MLNNYTLYKTKRYNKLKSRTRKGIPNCIRGKVWQLFGNISTLRKNNPTLFTDLKNRLLQEKILKNLFFILFLKISNIILINYGDLF